VASRPKNSALASTPVAWALASLTSTILWLFWRYKFKNYLIGLHCTRYYVFEIKFVKSTWIVWNRKSVESCTRSEWFSDCRRHLPI
jgi:hypothetical protein